VSTFTNENNRAKSSSSQKIAVMIINLNGKHHLKSCLDSLQNQTYQNFDTYIIDNGSSDGSLSYIVKNYPLVKIIAFSKNLGFAGAYNQAVKEIMDSNFVVFLNNDTKVDADWLRALCTRMFQENSIIAVGSKLKLYYSPSLLHNAGAKLSSVNGGFDIGLFEKDGEQFNIRRYVGATCGASMLVRRDLFLKIGGFDETYFAFFEDVDFCWRAWLYGYKIIYEPTSVVYHKRGGSFGSTSVFGTFLGGRNQLLTIMKNCQPVNLLTGLCLITPIFATRIILHLKERKLDQVFASCNAVLWVLRNLRLVINKRRVVQKNRLCNDCELSSLGVLASAGESIRENLKLMKSPPLSN